MEYKLKLTRAEEESLEASLNQQGDFINNIVEIIFEAWNRGDLIKSKK